MYSVRFSAGKYVSLEGDWRDGFSRITFVNGQLFTNVTPIYPRSWLEVSQLRELSPEPILRLLRGWLPSLDSSSIISS